MIYTPGMRINLNKKQKKLVKIPKKEGNCINFDQKSRYSCFFLKILMLETLLWFAFSSIVLASRILSLFTYLYLLQPCKLWDYSSEENHSFLWCRCWIHQPIYGIQRKNKDRFSHKIQVVWVQSGVITLKGLWECPAVNTP